MNTQCCFQSRNNIVTFVEYILPFKYLRDSYFRNTNLVSDYNLTIIL
jgi:hypothetical protein